MSEIARRPAPSALRREVGIPLIAVAVFVGCSKSESIGVSAGGSGGGLISGAG